MNKKSQYSSHSEDAYQIIVAEKCFSGDITVFTVS